MVRRFLSAPRGFSDQIETLVSIPGLVFGLVLGQKAADGKVLLIHLAPTPRDEEEAELDEDLTETAELEGLDVPWAVEHHKQIDRMLPGGIETLGVFFVSDVDVFSSVEGMAHVQRVLKAIHNTEGSHKSDGELMSVIHVDKSTKKVTAKMADPFQSGPLTLQTVKFKVEEGRVHWQKVQGTFLLDVPIAFGQSDVDLLLQEKVEAALKPLAKCVQSSVVIFDGSYRMNDDLLDLSREASKTKKGGSAAKKGRRIESDESSDEDEENDERKLKTYEIELLLQDDIDLLGGKEDCSVTTIHSRMRFAGKMFLCAFLHPDATVGEAAAAIRQDLIRSLRGRLQMHCDSLVGEETNGSDVEEAPILHEPPRRILVELPHADGVSISDYLFPGETPYDSNDSVEEVFGFKPDIASFDDEIELVAGPIETRETLGSSESGDESRASSPSSAAPASVLDRPGDFSRCSPLILVSAIAVGIASVVAGYFAFFVKDEAQEGAGVDDDLLQERVTVGS